MHYTITVDGGIKIGPTAIPAFWREQYKGLENFNVSEFLEILSQQFGLAVTSKFGFKKLAMEEMLKYYKPNMVKKAINMVKKAIKLCDGFNEQSFSGWSTPGIRAQLVNAREKKLEMDFVIEGDDKYDLVMLRGVIGYFDDPIFVIRKISKIISKGGYLYITATPNGQSFAFDVYREKWNLFSVDHVRFFSVKHLDDIMKKYRFSLVSHHYQYEEAPYANPESDFKKIKKDINLIESGNSNSIDSSVPFIGSMLTAVWKFNGVDRKIDLKAINSTGK